MTVDTMFIRPSVVAAAARDDLNQAAVQHLLAEAEQALVRKPPSVVDKPTPPPSNDRHDYVSYARYKWPDPAKPDGLPYVTRDGETNPESMGPNSDRPRFEQMAFDSMTLALAWLISEDDRYARHAVACLRRWFVNSSTAMNPNLNYGQITRGFDHGRSFGIIDTRFIVEALEAAAILREGEQWSVSEYEVLRRWCFDYLKWLEASELGRKEEAATNNHGTWFDVIYVALALFAGDTGRAESVLLKVADRRIDAHIRSDGSMPRELQRTRSFDYSVVNLQALTLLADIAGHGGLDIWHHVGPQGQSLGVAIDYLLPYVGNRDAWPHPQIEGSLPYASDFCLVLRRAAIALNNQRYERGLQSAPLRERLASRVDLILPRPDK